MSRLQAHYNRFFLLLFVSFLIGSLTSATSEDTAVTLAASSLQPYPAPEQPVIPSPVPQKTPSEFALLAMGSGLL